jgi:hypothetical protein
MKNKNMGNISSNNNLYRTSDSFISALLLTFPDISLIEIRPNGNILEFVFSNSQKCQQIEQDFLDNKIEVKLFSFQKKFAQVMQLIKLNRKENTIMLERLKK